jgi:hypothetical protein
MNGINGHAGLPALWQEARNADGRVYYYNTVTKATQWTKPEELMTPIEVRSISLGQRLFSMLIIISVPLPINRGRSILLKVAENTGTIPRRNRAPGKCQLYLRKLFQNRVWLIRFLQRMRDYLFD